MTPLVDLHVNPDYDPAALPPPGLDVARAAEAAAFHRTLPGYAPTALHRLDGLADRCGVARVWLKDESMRFGLKAFKALGASYAMARVAAGRDGALTVTTATDGNHGRAVGWAATALGHRAVVYVPAATSAVRVDAIAATGAEVHRVDGTYDDACAHAASMAERRQWILVQDTARPGYEQIPLWIMQGYLTLMHEVNEALSEPPPTHVLLQCGVGSFAAAMASFAVQAWVPAPRIVLAEPAAAPSALAAMRGGSDVPPLFDGDTHGFMACLSCGQLSSTAWPLLRRVARALLSCDDDVARHGMRLLAAPVGGDPVVVSGESGAVTAGALDLICRGGDPELRRDLELDREARVLLVSTEGDTDPAAYAAAVAGAQSSPR